MTILFLLRTLILSMSFNQFNPFGQTKSKAMGLLLTTLVFLGLYIFGIISLNEIIVVLVFGIVLTLLVFIHELGHYSVARLIGVKVEEFGFGLPPRVIGKKIGGTIYSLNALPIGGFVRLAGEDAEEHSIEERIKKNHGKNLSQFFWARTKLERIAILVAGVTMNFLLAVAITTGLLIYGIEEPAPRVKIVEVQSGSPAEIGGLMPGDLVKEIRYVDEKGNTKNVLTRLPSELAETTRANLGKELSLILLRNGTEQTIQVVPRTEFPPTEGPMGIKIDFDIQTLKYPWYQAPFHATVLSITRTRDMIMAIATLPSRAIQGQNVQQEIAGPIGIAQITGQAVRIGPVAVLNLMSILSLSLAFINILPIPALDGGRVLFVVIEAITGKRVNQGFERTAHQIGMIVLLALILLVTFNDITRLFIG